MVSKIEEFGEVELFNNIEMPLVRVLADMELTGIKVDKDYLEEVRDTLEKSMSTIEKEIYDKLINIRCDYFDRRSIKEIVNKALKAYLK